MRGRDQHFPTSACDEAEIEGPTHIGMKHIGFYSPDCMKSSLTAKE